MNKVLQNIIDRAKEITKVLSEHRDEIVMGLQNAETIAKEAQERKENAHIASDYNKACDDLDDANRQIQFYNRQMSFYNNAPRMSEEEYESAANAIDKYASDCAAEYKKIVYPAMNEILNAFFKYEAEIHDCDTAMIELDNAANVLQAKYPYRISKLVNLPPEKIPSRTAWKEHQKQYSTGANPLVYVYATTPDKNEKYESDVLKAAWNAVVKSVFYTSDIVRPVGNGTRY